MRDAADLDAAMTFVKSRYDLNLGLWDLARDPALRETLLEREAIAPPSAAPTVVPGELVAKATEKATEPREAEAAELDGRRRHHQAVWPTLSREGWHIPPWQREGVDYRLAAGPRPIAFRRELRRTSAVPLARHPKTASRPRAA